MDLYRRLYALPPAIRAAIECRYDGPIPEEAVTAGEQQARRQAASGGAP